MTDSKDEPGKGPARPGDGPRRPHATIDLQATEVGGKDQNERPAGAGSAKPARGPSALPPPGTSKSGFTELAARLAAASGGAARSNSFLSHVVAGVAGALLTFAAATLFGLFSAGTGGGRVASDVDQRLASLEQAMRQRAVAPGGDVAAKLAQTDTRLKDLENQARALTGLGDTQAKLAANIKALETRSSSPEYVNRLAKAESAIAALSAGNKTGPQAAALADKLTDLEKQIGDAAEASRSGSAQADHNLAVVKAEAGRLGQRLDAFKGEVDERLKGTVRSADIAAMTARLGSLEQELQVFVKSEGERTNNATRVLLTLEMASLKRAMDRGGTYAAELEGVRKVAGTTLNLKPLERYSLDGAPTVSSLAKEFRRVADTALDAEAEPADATVLDRLVSGAKSIVRVRKVGHDSADTSAEAVIGRMEVALKEGQLAEVLDQGKKLPPKAALVAEPWLKKVEARQTVDRSVAEIEAALKSSLGARAAASEPKR